MEGVGEVRRPPARPCGERSIRVRQGAVAAGSAALLSGPALPASGGDAVLREDVARVLPPHDAGLEAGVLCGCIPSPTRRRKVVSESSALLRTSAPHPYRSRESRILRITGIRTGGEGMNATLPPVRTPPCRRMLQRPPPASPGDPDIPRIGNHHGEGPRPYALPRFVRIGGAP